MKTIFGLDSYFLKQGQQQPVIWDSTKVINAHMLLVGKSGTGKTYTLNSMIQQFLKQPHKEMRLRIIDVHGDIDIPGSSSVKFSESSHFGFNPLAINPDPDFGGVRKRIQSFISAISKTSRKLGHKQESVLRNILQDLYAANGFYEKDADSWRLTDDSGRKIQYNGRDKKFPTLEDAYRYANFKHKAMFLGTSNKAALLLEDVNKKARQIYLKQKNLHKAMGKEELDILKAELKSAGQLAVEKYSEYIDNIENGMELTDLIKYDSKETLKSIVDILGNLVSSGIFKNVPPDHDPNAVIWRYDIKAITDKDEKKLFVYFLLEEIFGERVQKGMRSDVVEMVFLDEANIFFTDESDNIINIISKEARKFGLGLVCASQSPTHFSEDFMSSVATKIILGLDQMFWDKSVSKLKMEPQALAWIVPHEKILVQINNKGDLKNKFFWTILPKKNN
jgi:DNA helicase HerA-like ATPase